MGRQGNAGISRPRRRDAGRVSSTRRAFTLLEVLVVIGVLGVLAALLLVAIQRARTAARRIACGNQLRQLGLALGMYHDQHRVFPDGGQITSQYPYAYHAYSVHTALLPFVEQQNVYDRFDFRYNTADPGNYTAIHSTIDLFLCPDDRESLGAQRLFVDNPVNYCPNGGTWYYRSKNLPPAQTFDGLIVYTAGEPRRRVMIRDGEDRTAAFAEVLRGPGPHGRGLRNIYQGATAAAQIGKPDTFRAACQALDPNTALFPVSGRKAQIWYMTQWGGNVYNHVMGPNERSCTWGPGIGNFANGIAASSNHPGGVNVVMISGSQRFVSEHLDHKVWWALGSIAGGETVSDF